MSSVAYWIPACPRENGGHTGMVGGGVPFPRKWESSGQTFLTRGLVACWIPACALLLLQLSTHAGAGELDGPAATVERFHGKLLSVMQRAEELGYRGRYEELEPYVNGCFDIPFIAHVVLGRHREQLNEAQKKEFAGLFGRASTATYASRFDGHSGEEFRELSREPLKRGRVLIRTELRRPDDDPVALDYLLHEKQGNWYIISVSADGVNDLSLKRAEYAAVIKEKGFNGLVKEISSKIAEMESDTE